MMPKFLALDSKHKNFEVEFYDSLLLEKNPVPKIDYLFVLVYQFEVETQFRGWT
jgi:hypothetical protein